MLRALSVSLVRLLFRFFQPTVFIISVIFAVVNVHELTSGIGHVREATGR